MSVPAPQPARQPAADDPEPAAADRSGSGEPVVADVATVPTSEKETGAPRGSHRFNTRRLLGLALLLVAVTALGWVGYQYVGTNLVSQQVFEQEVGTLRATWESRPAPSEDPATPGVVAPEPARGEAIALLRIPAFGEAYEVPILEGTDLDTLSRGVGHYASTAEPGAVGNFAIAGHRVTHGRPFGKLLELDRGDQIVVETARASYTYVVDIAPREVTVEKTAGWVLDPVPGEPASSPARALITLTTSQDLIGSADRSVGFGHLQSITNKE